MDGFRIREFRVEVGLTQAEVARELSVDKRTVFRWEKRKAKIKGKLEGMFITLVSDPEEIDRIKRSRPKRVRGRPFQKKYVDRNF
jgi:DNA-binding transcriptional regulator YiaG